MKNLEFSSCHYVVIVGLNMPKNIDIVLLPIIYNVVIVVGNSHNKSCYYGLVHHSSYALLLAIKGLTTRLFSPMTLVGVNMD